MIRRRNLLTSVAGGTLLAASAPLLAAFPRVDGTDPGKSSRIALPELTESAFEEFVRRHYGQVPDRAPEFSPAIHIKMPSRIEAAGRVPVTISVEAVESEYKCTALHVYGECVQMAERGSIPSNRMYTYRIMAVNLGDSTVPYLSFFYRLYNPPAAIGVVATLRHISNGGISYLYNRSAAIRDNCADCAQLYRVEWPTLEDQVSGP